jgi:hypothetical protein
VKYRADVVPYYFHLSDANALELQWDSIQESYYDLKGKSMGDCKRRWALWLKPSIHKGEWSPTEAKYIVALRY